MSQFLSQSMNQQMRMEQRLTPQLIQSMAVLQKPVAELEAFIAAAKEGFDCSASALPNRKAFEPCARAHSLHVDC